MPDNSLLFITGMFVFPFVCVLLPIVAGQRCGLYTKKRTGKVNESPVGSVVAASLGLLAFMLAFTFQIVDNRYSSRKELLLNEVTTIRTAYLQSGLIPQNYKAASRNLLLEYTDIRVALIKDTSPERLDKLKMRSQTILDSLWNYSEALASKDRSSEAYSLYTASISELIEIYHKRVTFTFEYRMPVAILWVLFLVTCASMFLLGFQFGISGRRHHILAVFISVIFASVMFLILALDNPETGLIRLNQTPILTLYKELSQR
ncbi:hypothetical protein [Flavobacterium sp. LAR06]|uniref:bestrophin-like domain n=1 Tax=Flavobacterium sp. LAR06 TaxID=3064897 RepID=UPI0035BF6D9D